MCRTKSLGSILIGLIIVLAIVGILAAIAMPSYQNNRHAAYYSEVMQAAVPYQSAVNECVQNLKTVKGCDASSHAIPPAISVPAGVVTSLSVIDGVITVTPIEDHGVLEADTYILTPTFDEKIGRATWVSSGGGVIKGYGK